MLDDLIAELNRRAPSQVQDPDRPQAAVSLLLTPDPDRLLLIRRAERQGDPWSGHLALPGGRRQASDTDLLTTAIRETEEETGIRLEREWRQAQLDDLVPQTPTLPPILVRPFVFVLRDAVIPGISAEVVHAAWLPLAHLIADGVYGIRPVDVRGEARMVQGYQLAEGFLWGMTERILSPILSLWKELAEAGRTDVARG